MVKHIRSKRSQRGVLFLFFTAGLIFAGSCSEQPRWRAYEKGYSTKALSQPGKLGPATEINWKRLTDRAAAENRPVYIHFYASLCPLCWNFEVGTLLTPDVKQTLRRVIYIKANVDRERILAYRFGVSHTPAGVLLRPRNHELIVVDKHLSGLPPAQFIDFLNQALPRKHQNGSKDLRKMKGRRM
jgi:thioredoxin-like negative regulator of GroEL